MKANRVRSTERASQMREVLRELNSSGESVKKFCARKDITTWSVYYWRRRLREGTVGKTAPARQPALLPIQVVDDNRAGSTSYEIGLRSGCTLKVMPGFSSIELERLLGVLDRC